MVECRLLSPLSPSSMHHEDVIRTRRNPRGLHDVEFVVDGETLGELEDVAGLFRFGSHLYGTAGPDSDLDIKGIFVESTRRIVLKRDRDSVRLSTGGETNRNSPGDVDVECLELRKFVGDALEGQTYAVELLHAPDASTLVEADLFAELRDRRDRLLSQRVEPFVGYCRTQARRYGRKGRRLAAVEEVLEVLEARDPSEPIETVLDELPEDSEFVELVEQPIRGQEEPVELLEVAGKKFERHARIEKALTSLRGIRDEYGDRAKRAREGVDWKAVSHAYRVVFELRELMSTGRIDFPLDRADFLKRVKRGDVAYERVRDEIPELVDSTLEIESVLPEAPDRTFWEDWLVELYRTRAAEGAT